MALSATMLVAAALIIIAAAFCTPARNSARPTDVQESRSALTFWIMLQAVWAA